MEVFFPARRLDFEEEERGEDDERYKDTYFPLNLCVNINRFPKLSSNPMKIPKQKTHLSRSQVFPV